RWSARDIDPRRRSGLLRGRLPQFDARAFGVGDPAEAAEVALVDAFVHFDAIDTQLRQQCVEIVDAEVDHVRLRARAEVAGVGGERRPQGVAGALFVFVETDAAPLLGGEAEVFRVPGRQCGGVARFE